MPSRYLEVDPVILIELWHELLLVLDTTTGVKNNDLDNSISDKIELLAVVASHSEPLIDLRLIINLNVVTFLELWKCYECKFGKMIWN
jgi:hypothetical protein